MITHATALHQAGNESAGSTYIQGHKIVLSVVVSSHGL